MTRWLSLKRFITSCLLASLFVTTPTAHASAVRSVLLSFADSTHGTVTINSRFGTIVLNVSVSGTSWTVAGTNNGVSIGSVTRTSPATTTLESDCATTISSATKDGGVAGMQIAVHFISTNPIKFTIFTAEIGVSIPSNWWITT